MSRAKRGLFKSSAFALLFLGTVPSWFVASQFGSILPLLGGLYLAFTAYILVLRTRVTLQITREGITICGWRRDELTRWTEIEGFRLGTGIYRHDVVCVLSADAVPPDAGSDSIDVPELRWLYLPDTFGLSGKKLVTLLTERQQAWQRQAGLADGTQ